MATIKEIAEQAHVSTATVSRVLNKDDTLVVSAEVKSNIFKIAHELSYLPPKMRHVQKENEIIIGIADWHIIRKDRPNIDMNSFEIFADDILTKENVKFVRMEYLSEVKVHGIIAFGVFSQKEMEFLREQSFCIVFVNSDEKNYEYDSIVMDYMRGIENMISYLIDQKQYRSIGYIGGIYKDSLVQIGVKRIESLKDILKKRGIYDASTFMMGDISKESGYELMKQMLSRDSLPEVIVLGSDEVAEGALDAMKGASLRIPKDVAVVIYKDIETIESKYPTYTKLRMLPKLVWTTAIKLVLERVVQKRADAMKIYLPTKLEIGDST